MPDSTLFAADVALLLPDPVQARAQAINSLLLRERPDGFRFDNTHLPHLTLAQLFLRRSNLPALIERVDAVVRGRPPLRLQVTGFGGTPPVVHFAIEPAPELQRLHQTLMDDLRELEEPGGAAEAFYSDAPSRAKSRAESPRDRDVDWVRNFRSHAGYRNFEPHITLGIGTPPAFPGAFDFTADRVALCHLGRFCTCRRVIKEWSLA